jgi:hypothetical protein
MSVLTVLVILSLALGGLLLFRRRRAQRYAARSADSTEDESSWTRS